MVLWPTNPTACLTFGNLAWRPQCRRWNPAWPRSRKLSGLKAPGSDRIDDMIAALLPYRLPQHSSPTLLWDTSLHTSLQPPLRHLSKTPCPTISTTLLYQIHPQHFPTTLLSNIVQQQYPNQPIPASRKHKINTDQHDPALQNAKTPCNPGWQTTLDCKHAKAIHRPARPWIANTCIHRPARPWLATHKSNTQTTLDCKRTHTQTKYTDQHDPGLQTPQINTNTCTTLECKLTKAIQRPARSWIATHRTKKSILKK